MDFTLSPDYQTHAGTGQRMHQDTAPVTTAVTSEDMNSLIWSLMEFVKAAGLSGIQFDAATPATYQRLRAAFDALYPRLANLGNSTLTAKLARVEAGGGPSTYTLARFMANELITAHAHYGFLDDSTINFAGGAPVYGHASHADNVSLIGATPSDHHHSFQSYPHYGTAATIARLSGFWMQPDITAGTVTELSEFRANDPLGGGTITALYGFYCDALTRGATNWSFFGKGPTEAFFGGTVRLGSGVTPYAAIGYAADGSLEVTARATYDTRLICKKVLIGDTGDATATSLDNNADGNFYLTPRAGYAAKVVGPLEASGPIRTAAYTVGTLPSAAAFTRAVIYVSNESGGATTAFSDGTNWRRHTDRAIVT